MIEVKHKVYGKMLVSEEELRKPDPFILAHHVTRSDMAPMHVGKAALDNQGGYKSRRGSPERVERFLPLVKKMATRYVNKFDDWEEAYSILAMWLVNVNDKMTHLEDWEFGLYVQKSISFQAFNRKKKMEEATYCSTDDVELTDTSRPTERIVDINKIYSAFDNLKPFEREVCRRYYILGQTLNGVAKATGSNYSAVLRARNSGLSEVRNALKNKDK